MRRNDVDNRPCKFKLMDIYRNMYYYFLSFLFLYYQFFLLIGPEIYISHIQNCNLLTLTTMNLNQPCINLKLLSTKFSIASVKNNGVLILEISFVHYFLLICTKISMETCDWMEISHSDIRVLIETIYSQANDISVSGDWRVTYVIAKLDLCWQHSPIPLNIDSLHK